MSKFVARAQHSFATDVNWDRVRRYSVIGVKAAPAATSQYLLDKVPIVGWLPRYRPRWLLVDFIAGLTLAMMLIPQSLAYAAIATIPVEHGLMASWLPASIYAFMGTSKGTNTPQSALQ
jgi:solute carrier family 26 (sodium-independent sulfate anion transporter), member 11